VASKPPVAVQEVKRMSHRGLYTRLDEVDPAEDGEIMGRVLSDRSPNPHRERLLQEKLGR
jgi:hypothetical protein